MTERDERLESIRAGLQRLGLPDDNAALKHLCARLSVEELATIRRICTAAEHRSEAPDPPDMTADLFAGETWLGRVGVMPFLPDSDSDGRRESWALDLANGATLAGLIADAGGGESLTLELRIRPRPGRG